MSDAREFDIDNRHSDASILREAMADLAKERAAKERVAQLMEDREELAAIRAEVALTAQVVLALETHALACYTDALQRDRTYGPECPTDGEQDARVAERTKMLTLRARQAELEKAVQP